MNEQYQDEQNSVFDTVVPFKEYASVGQRFANFLIDLAVGYLLVLGFFIVLAIALPNLISYFTEGSMGSKLMDRLLTALILIIVYSITEGATKGKTLGKLITGTRAVQDDTYEPITWKQAILRSLSRFVPFEALSGFGGHPLHDRWTKTCVIKIR